MDRTETQFRFMQRCWILRCNFHLETITGEIRIQKEWFFFKFLDFYETFDHSKEYLLVTLNEQGMEYWLLRIVQLICTNTESRNRVYSSSSGDFLIHVAIMSAAAKKAVKNWKLKFENEKFFPKWNWWGLQF